MRRLGSAGMSYTQVFLLVVGFGIASALIFLFGMWVGRDIAERRLAQEERIVRQPVTIQPPTEEAPREGEVDRAFYERLKDKAVQRLTEATKTEAVGTTTPGVAPTPTTNLLFPTRVPTRTLPRSTATIATPRPRPSATPASPAAAGDEWADAGWTVQILATNDASTARDTVMRLRSRGFEAYIVQAPQRGDTMTVYRVRVGRFSNKERAKEMEQRLKAEEGIDAAFVAPQ